MSVDKYLKMQFDHYEEAASKWSILKRNHVVGGYDKHNAWVDYDKYLFKDFDTTDKIALDYGTGPGRNIIKFWDRFARIDGVDIGETNIKNAKDNLIHAGIKGSNLFVCDGKGTPCDDESYDVWFSVICLQHIASHDIRSMIFEDAYRVLKSGGYICFQMAYGGRDLSGSRYKTYSKNSSIKTAGYYDNDFDAETTNGRHDVSITDPEQIVGDLEKIGFTEIKFDIRPVGPGCSHKNWIFVQGQKNV